MIFAQMRRELMTFFYSPMAYVLLITTTLVNSVTFSNIMDAASSETTGHGAAMQTLFTSGFFFILNLAACAFITMRMVAEEKSSGTLEMLLTSPINETQIVLAKYFSALIFFIVLWLPTTIYPVILERFSDVSPGPIIAGYLGTFTLGAMFISVGIFFSTVTRNQIIAALATFVTNMIFFFVSAFNYYSDPASDSPLMYMDLVIHMTDFARGIVDSRPIVYYLSVSIFVLFCSVQVLQSRRWRA